MKKIDKKWLLLTSLLILLPVIIGLVLWNKLPDTLPTHFGLDGQADGFSSKFEAVVGMPFVMLGLHLFAVFVTSRDPKAGNVTPKMQKLVYWIIPVILLVIQLMVYGSALGWIHGQARIGNVILALIFIVIGNYLPKIKQNYTVGIKLPWTLDNEENWNKTHRLAGRLWVFAGLFFLVNALFPFSNAYLFAAMLIGAVVAPCVYSYRFSCKN